MDWHLQKLILRSYPKESEEFHGGGSFWLPWWRGGKQRSGRKEADWICQSKRHLDQIIQIKNRVYQEHIHSLKIRSNICARWSICTKYNPTLPPTVFCTQCHCILYVIFVCLETLTFSNLFLPIIMLLFTHNRRRLGVNCYPDS